MQQLQSKFSKVRNNWATSCVSLALRRKLGGGGEGDDAIDHHIVSGRSGLSFKSYISVKYDGE